MFLPVLLGSATAATPSFAVGYVHRAQRDLLGSPLPYTIASPTVRGGIEAGRTAAWMELRAEHWGGAGLGGRAWPFTRTDPLTGDDASFSFRPPAWGVGAQLGVQGGWPIGPVALGPRVATDVRQGTLAANTWALHETSADVRLSGSRGPVTAGVWLPIVAVVTRMPYGLDPLIPGRSQVAGFFASGTMLQTWNVRQAVGTDVTWRTPAARWDLGITADARWSHSARPESLHAIDARLLATIWRAR